MKKSFLYIIVAACCLSSFVSCKGMLDEESYGKPTSEDLLSDETNMVMLVGQAYAEVKWLHDHWGYWGINTLASDEALCPTRNPGNDWADDGYWRGFNDHTWTSKDLSFENVWNTSSSGAVLCNKILKQIEGQEQYVDPEVYSRYKAELEVLRAYYFYTLFDSFGKVPYTESYDTVASVADLLEVPEVWSKLVLSLEDAAKKLPHANMPSKSANYGRASKGMAYALLSRLYLNAESYGVTPEDCQKYGVKGINTVQDFYSKCVIACDSVINSKVYYIEPDFFTNFKVYNENSEENIFVIVENGNGQFDYQDFAGKMANKLRITMLTLNYMHKDIWGMLEKPWNGFCARPSFLARYEYGVDRRGPCDSIKGTKTDFDAEPWGWFLGPVWNTEGTDTLVMEDKGNLSACMTSSVRALEDATHNDGARLLKYQVEKNSTLNKYCENDFVLIRYAEVLYNKAEAILRGGNGNLAELVNTPDFQLIRTRVGVQPYTASLTLDELLSERGREFAWECVRRRDLIRFNKFNDPSYIDFLSSEGLGEYRKWFPIPYKQIEVSGGKWQQWEGYAD